jgi:predicted MFS family arabinose efflux permease
MPETAIRQKVSRNGPMRWLQISTAATSLGKWAFAITLGVYAFREGGTAAIGIVAIVQAIPATLAAPVLGLAADRYPRRRVLLVTNGLRVLVLAAVAVGADQGAPVAVIFALAALFAVISTANQPARAALIPVLARTPAEVSQAMAVMGAIDTTSFLVGAGVGGIVLASTSVSFVVEVCAIAYAVATLLLLQVPLDARPARRAHEHPVAELAAGLHTVLADIDLRLVFTIMAALSVIDGLTNVLVIVTSINLLGIGTAGIGYLNIARGAGGILGGAFAFALLGRSRVAAAVAAGSLTLGVPLILLGVLPRVPIGVLAWGAFGCGFVLVKVSGLTLVQRLSGDRVLGRVLAVLETTFVATIGLGAILAPALVAVIGLQGALIVTGAALPVVALARIGALRRLQAGPPVPQREFELLRRCPVFAPLPLATIEGLARHHLAVDVPAGSEVITEGEIGDRFYVIASGGVEVLQDGTRIRTQGPGESFGEIALLRDVPRTATVRALESTRLLAIERERFLLSVTGHADSHHAATEIADRFLAAPADTPA